MNRLLLFCLALQLGPASKSLAGRCESIFSHPFSIETDLEQLRRANFARKRYSSPLNLQEGSILSRLTGIRKLNIVVPIVEARFEDEGNSKLGEQGRVREKVQRAKVLEFSTSEPLNKFAVHSWPDAWAKNTGIPRVFKTVYAFMVKPLPHFKYATLVLYFITVDGRVERIAMDARKYHDGSIYFERKLIRANNVPVYLGVHYTPASHSFSFDTPPHLELQLRQNSLREEDPLSWPVGPRGEVRF